MSLRIIDFFCGAGGSTLGALLAGFDVVAAVNHWIVAATSYESNHDLRPLRSSVADVEPHELPHADGYMFSPECTEHSEARGAQEKDETSRNQGWDVVRFVSARRPAFFTVENVLGFRRWPDFRRWAAALQDLGYALNHDEKGVPGQMLCAADWGVPQTRKRLFVVGVRGQAEPIIRSPRQAHVPISECLDWSFPMGRIADKKRAPKTMARIEIGRRLYGDAPFIIVYYGSGPQVFGLDRPCRTVPCRDRFSLVAGDRIRFLQPLELLRIQGFPDTYTLSGTKAEKKMQIGNAVPPALMRGILEQVA